jgi:two-component system, cell cycle sensor histidine kinase and response regulator CckA
MSNSHILIVDDELIIAQNIQNHLKNLGYNVVGIAINGAEAINQAGKLRPNLVLMDINLSGEMDGITAADQIRASYHIPVIYLTAYADDEILARAKVTEPFGYILKPFSLKELRSTIETALYKHQSELALLKANRSLKILSECNQVLVRVEDEAALLHETCRILVETGGYRLAWVGLVEHDQQKSVRPVAQAGDSEDYLKTIRISWANNKYGRGPTGRAIRNKKPVICRDILTDPHYTPWRESAQSYGYTSSIALPLLVNGQPLGALNIYAAEPDAFDQTDIELLQELTNDLAYGLLALRTRAQHQQMEEVLLRQQARLNSIFRVAPVGIGVTVNRVLTEVNDYLCQMVGYPAEQLIGQSARILYPTQADFDFVGREKYRQIAAHGIGTVETCWQCKNGRIIDVLLSSTPLVPDDLAAGVTFTALNITERKQTAETLARERNLLRALIDLLPYPVYAKDAAARKTLSNRADLYNIGVTTESEVLGKTDFDLFPQDIAANFYADDQLVLQTGQSVLNREEIILVDGQSRWYLTSKVPLRDSSGQVIGLVGVGHDITERKLAEESLRENENRYRRLLESVTDYIYTVQLDQGRPVSTTHGPGCAGVTGYTPEEYAATPYLWYTMVHEDDQAAVIAQAAQVSAGEMLPPLEHRIIHKNGSIRWVRHTAVPRYNENGQLVAYDGLITNITERKLAEEEKERLQVELVQAQKLEALGRLTGGIAHDFNNMLTAINGFAELAQHRLPEDSPLQEMLGYILDSGQRAANLVRQLLAFSRKQIIEPKIMNLNALITDLNKMLQRIITETIKIETVLSPDLYPIKMDPAQVEQIIVNLVVNARDALPQGGKLTIKTANVILDETYTALHPDTPPGNYILLTISDNGQGISEAILPHIFEPFFTTKKPDKGTGLGLAMVYGIVKQNHGDIEVYSKAGEGTVFKIYLPCLTDTTQQSPRPSAATLLPTGSETILLAEDDPEVRQLTRQILVEQGYTVLETTDGLEALERAQKYTQPIDLLLTDVVMPGLNGKVLAEKLARTRPNIKILFISGYTDDTIAHHGVLESGIILLQKPFSAADLSYKIRTILDTP